MFVEGGLLPGSVLGTEGAGVHRVGQEFVMPKKQKETEGKQMRHGERAARYEAGVEYGGAYHEEMYLGFCAFFKYRR